MCRYVSTFYTHCPHTKTSVYRCAASFDAFPHAPTSACRPVEEPPTRFSHPYCMDCRRKGKGRSRLYPVSNLAGRLVGFIDNTLGYKSKPRAKGQAPKTLYELKTTRSYANPNLGPFLDRWDTADAVSVSIEASTITSTSVNEQSIDTDSWATHVLKHKAAYKGINKGWGEGTRNRESWFSFGDDDESRFAVGENPFRKNPLPFIPEGVRDDRDSLPSRRSSPSSTSSLVPQPLNIRSSRPRDSLHLPESPLEIPVPLRVGGPRPSSRAREVAGADLGHYDVLNRRHAVIFGELVEFDDSDSEAPSFHSSEDEGSAHWSEVDVETTTSTRFELEATSIPGMNPAYDGSLYGDVVTALPDNWDWEDFDTSSDTSRSRTPARSEMLFQHPDLRQDWSSRPASNAAGSSAHVEPARAPREAGGPPTRFEHFEFPIGGNEVPIYEGSIHGSISRFWASN